MKIPKLLIGTRKEGRSFPISALGAAAKALGELIHLGCWLGKQANVTSEALSHLLKDKETTRHAKGKTRAAIAFLLPAHGPGCQEFEGLCCINPTSNTESIHRSTQLLKDQVKDIKIQRSKDWLEGMVEGLGLKGWSHSFTKDVLLIV